MRFLYIGRISWCMADAASIRVHNIGAMLKSQGHEVDYICQEGTVPNGRILHGGSVCYGVFDEKTTKPQMLWEWLFGKGAIRCLKRLLKTEHYDGLILYNTPITTAKKAQKLCRKNGIAIFGDVTEWYDLNPSKGLASYSYAWLVDRRIRFFDPKCDGIIAISPYLENYYRGKVPVFNLPPVFEGEGHPNSSQNQCPGFLYAGSPSKKDDLYTFLEAVKEINCEQVRVEMTVIGAPIPSDKEQLAEKGIQFHSRMPHEAILEALGTHDFSVLLRPKARYAMAGYSTKVAEALHNGTPVFCNEIGGADVDIRDGFNGIKLCSMDIEAVKEALLRVIQMTPEEMTEIKRNAFGFGRDKYSGKHYERSLCEFMTRQSR